MSSGSDITGNKGSSGHVVSRLPAWYSMDDLHVFVDLILIQEGDRVRTHDPWAGIPSTSSSHWSLYIGRVLFFDLALVDTVEYFRL